MSSSPTKPKTLHFIGQMYKSDYFTEEQMTKYEILANLDKIWDKTLTHFMDLYALRKAYGDDRAANSRVLPTSEKILWATASSPLRAT